MIKEIDSLDNNGSPQMHDLLDASDTVAVLGIEATCFRECGQGVCYLATEAGQDFAANFKTENNDVTEQLRIRKPEKQFAMVELPTVSGEELKQILMSRLAIFNDPELISKLNKLHNKDHPDEVLTDEEFSEGMNNAIIPVKDDATWDTFARFVKGNIRLAQSIFAFFQEAHLAFRSPEPSCQKAADNIARNFVSRDGSWSKTYPGFRPANPYEVTELDFNKLAAMIDEQGWLSLPHSFRGSYTMCWVTDNPAEYAEWRIQDGIIVEHTAGRDTILPSARRLAIEAHSSSEEEA